MPNFNKVYLMGNLTRDPETKYLPSGSQVCELGMAVNRTWTDQSGERREQVCYVDLSAWGRQAETLARYMKKGQPLFVEGRLDYSTWDGPDGQKRSKLRVVIENFQFLGARQEGGGPPGSGPAPRVEHRPAQAASAPASAPPPISLDEDDIPF